MSGYNQVDVEFWADTIDWPADERDLAIYLLTCEYRNQEGLFRIRTAQIVLDRAWPEERVEAALAGLAGRGWCIHENGWMLLTKSLRWAPPAGPKQIPGAVKKVKNVPRDSRIWRDFHAAAMTFAPDFGAKLDDPRDTHTGTADTVSSARDTDPFSTQLNSSSSSTPPRGARNENEPPASDVIAPPAVTEAVVVKQVTPQIREALRAAGFDSWTIENNDAGIGLALNELQVPDDVDWFRVGVTLRKAREDGECRTTKPDSAIRFVAKGFAGFPRLGRAGKGPQPVQPVEEAWAQIQRLEALEREQAA